MKKKATLASLVTLAFALFLGAGTSDSKSKTWSAEGTLLDACQCAVFCACEFNGKPTAGHCDDSGLVEITKGHYGDVVLDGKKMIVVTQSPHGKRVTESVGKLNFAHIYVEKGDTAVETQALAAVARKMLGTFVDGADRIAKSETVDRVPILVSTMGDQHSFSVPNVLDVEFSLVKGGDKKTPIVIANHPFNEYGYANPQVGRSTKYTFDDGKHQWDYSGRSASVRTFKVDGTI